MIDLTEVIVAALTLIFACISAFLIPYLKAKFNAEQLETMLMWVNLAVEAADMLYEGVGRGAEKKQYVLELLESKGFTVNEAELDAFIEAAVLNLKLMKKEEASS